MHSTKINNLSSSLLALIEDMNHISFIIVNIVNNNKNNEYRNQLLYFHECAM